jgi:hypothetical protein
MDISKVVLWVFVMAVWTVEMKVVWRGKMMVEMSVKL